MCIRDSFKKMIVDVVQNGNCIFLFGDNFLDRTREAPGANTAVLRPFAFTEPCRAVGIPTGWCIEAGGFNELTLDVKKAITCSFERLNTVLHEQPTFKTVYYSADPADTESMGFKLFAPCDEVRKYIKKKLSEVSKRFDETETVLKWAKIEATEHRLEDGALRTKMMHMSPSKKQKRRAAAVEEEIEIDEDDE